MSKTPSDSSNWKSTLTPEQFRVMRQEGTEPPFSSPLNDEKRPGIFVCMACKTPLFQSESKYDSGSGWPSFYDAIEGAIATKEDASIMPVRTEYHCANCGSHLGHVFEDGPQPTGLRYCNNGVALEFIPSE